MTDHSAETPMTAESLAQLFHETYERLAPDHGYRTREASAKPWADVPDANKALMVATCAEVLAAINPTAELGRINRTLRETGAATLPGLAGVRQLGTRYQEEKDKAERFQRANDELKRQTRDASQALFEAGAESVPLSAGIKELDQANEALAAKLDAAAARHHRHVMRGVIHGWCEGCYKNSGTIVPWPCAEYRALDPAPESPRPPAEGDLAHFAPYGAEATACGEPIPPTTPWEPARGDWVIALFTTRRAKTTCPRCLGGFNAPAESNGDGPTADSRPETRTGVSETLSGGHVSAWWRVGRSVGRTVYAMTGDEPSKADVLIGVMDTRRLAAAAVEAHNATLPVPSEEDTDA